VFDISPRKFAEEALQEERFLFRTLIDNVPQSIFYKNLDSEFELANKHCVRWLGANSEEEMIGKTDLDFFTAEHGEQAIADEKHVIDSQKPLTTKVEKETWSDQGDTWVNTTKFPWFDRKGNIKGTFGISADVTDLVNSKMELLKQGRQMQEANRSFEKELQLAREVQLALVQSRCDFSKQTLSVGGSTMEIDFDYIPASSLAGDFLDVVKIDDNRLGVLICDVMGHGVRSALVVAMIRGLMEKQKSLAIEPGSFLSGLNDGLTSILKESKITMFATAIYAVIDKKLGTLSFASAGHTNPIVMKNGEVEIIDTMSIKGPGLGLMPEIPYPQKTIELAEVQRMAFYTDGIIEASNPDGEEYGEERVADFMRSSAESTSFNADLLKEIQRFQKGQAFEDDVCMMTLNFTASDDEQWVVY